MFQEKLHASWTRSTAPYSNTNYGAKTVDDELKAQRGENGCLSTGFHVCDGPRGSNGARGCDRGMCRDNVTVGYTPEDSLYNFDSGDLDGDGILSRDELKAHRAALEGTPSVTAAYVGGDVDPGAYPVAQEVESEAWPIDHLEDPIEEIPPHRRGGVHATTFGILKAPPASEKITKFLESKAKHTSDRHASEGPGGALACCAARRKDPEARFQTNASDGTQGGGQDLLKPSTGSDVTAQAQAQAQAQLQAQPQAESAPMPPRKEKKKTSGGCCRPTRDQPELICERCGNMFLEDSIYCRNCGAKRPSVEFQAVHHGTMVDAYFTVRQRGNESFVEAVKRHHGED